MSSSKLKPSQSKENLKQKSLMSFFSKGPQTQTPATPAAKRRLQDTSSDAPSSSSPLKQTPKFRKASSSSVMSAALSGSSDGKSHRTGSPPPSSDAVDVDMLSDEEELQPKKVSPCYLLYDIAYD
jgi:DNA mismatch repair protein MSH6